MEEKQLNLSQASKGLMDSAQKFNKYKTWFDQHEVQKGKEAES